jgi:hypothetical protein
MSAQLYLSSHLHAAVIGDDLVVLDGRSDAYFCVPDGVAALGFSGSTRSLSPATSDTVYAVLAEGLATYDPPQRGAAPVPQLPSLGVPFDGPVPVRLRDIWRLAGAALDLGLRYRGRSLSEILAYVTRARRPVVATDDLETLVRRFHTAAIWLPDSRKCLIRSFLLLRFLQRSGHTAQWVFGVRTWPFGAHCWLQVGDRVLDDVPEQLLKYRPIRVV